MAEISETFELLKVVNSRDTSIESVENESSIVVSSRENGFVKFNLESRKVIHSWAISRAQSLSAPAIFDHQYKKYHSVMNDKELFSWDDEHYSLSEVKMNMVKTEYPVVKLHPISNGGVHDILLIDRSGMTYFESKTNKNVEGSAGNEEAPMNSNRRYVWSSVLNEDESGNTYVAVVFEEDKKYHLALLLVQKSKESLEVQESCKYILKSLAKGSFIIACTLQAKKLIVLWSGGTLYSYQLPNHPNEWPGFQLHKMLIKKLSSDFEISESSKAKIGKIDLSHIFVVSKCMIGGKKQGVVGILSTKFGTEQARTTFPISSDKDESLMEQEILSAICHRGHVIIALSQSIKACSCSIFSSSLAAALGKLDKSEAPKPKTIILLSSPKRKIEDKEEEEQRHRQEKKKIKLMENLTNPLKTPTVEDFNHKLDSFLKKFFVKGVQKDNDDKSLNPEKKKKKKSGKKQKYNWIPEDYLKLIIKRCLEDDNIWSSKAILRVVESTCIPPSLCSELITESIKRRSLDVLEKCYECIEGINEKDVVKTIQFILSWKNDSESSGKPGNAKEALQQDAVKIDDEPFKLLLQILNYSHNEYSLQEMLRSLSRQETKEILQILLELLSRQTFGIKLPVSHDKVIDWISMITNAQFTTIILTNDIYSVIKRIQKTIGNQMKFFKKLETLEPFLMCLKKAYKLPNAVKTVGAYSVDTIVI